MTQSEWINELQELRKSLEQFAIRFAAYNYKMQGYCKDFTQEDLKRFSEMCDLGFLYRELGEQAKDIATTANKWNEKISEILCLGCCIRSMQAGKDISIRGELATGSMKVDIQPKLPKRDSIEHVMLCEHFGIPKENAYLFSPHFVAFTEVLTKLAEEGKPIPPGIVGKYEKYGMVYRRKDETKHE